MEAARAGEQGKGFAVVAGEVRSLAQRSAQAAKEIKLLIEDSVDKVGVGAQQGERAGATMQEIVASVRRVTDIIGEISAASAEQSSGIEQVNRAVSQMDETTQQNAALVEEAAAAAGSMQDQAGELVRAVSAFRLADGAAQPMRNRPRAPRGRSPCCPPEYFDRVFRPYVPTEYSGRTPATPPSAWSRRCGPPRRPAPARYSRAR